MLTLWSISFREEWLDIFVEFRDKLQSRLLSILSLLQTKPVLTRIILLVTKLAEVGSKKLYGHVVKFSGFPLSTSVDKSTGDVFLPISGIHNSPSADYQTPNCKTGSTPQFGGNAKCASYSSCRHSRLNSRNQSPYVAHKAS
jgi:hypothetical protein